MTIIEIGIIVLIWIGAVITELIRLKNEKNKPRL